MYYKSKLNVIFFPDKTFTTFMMIYKNYHYFNSRKAAAYMYKIYYLLSFLKHFTTICYIKLAKYPHLQWSICSNYSTKNNKTCLELRDVGNLYLSNKKWNSATFRIKRITHSNVNDWKQRAQHQCACRQHKTSPCTNQKFDKFCCSCISVLECFNKCYCLRMWQISFSEVVSCLRY